MGLFAATRFAIVRGVVLALLGSAVASPTSADPILTGSSGLARVSVELLGSGLPPQSDEATFGPLGGAAVAEVGRNRAVQTGAGINAVNVEAQLSDILFFRSRADTHVDWVIENPGPAADDLIFSYTINGGRLRLFDPAGSFTGLDSTVAVSIDMSGVIGPLWEWGVTLTGTSPGVVEAHIHGFGSIFDFQDPLGLGSPAVSAVSVSATEAVVTIAPFTATVDLGKMSPAERARITYQMFGQVSGPASRLSGASATVGDPFNLQSSPGSTISFNGGGATIPEPSALALVGLGGAALLRRARRPKSLKASALSAAPPLADGRSR